MGSTGDKSFDFHNTAERGTSRHMLPVTRSSWAQNKKREKEYLFNQFDVFLYTMSRFFVASAAYFEDWLESMVIILPEHHVQRLP